MRIDSHHHFWNYSPAEYAWIDEQMSVLKRDFAPNELRQETRRVGIDGVLSVQARQTIQETNWLLQIADQHEFIKGVIGWLPLASDQLQQALESLSNQPMLKATRHVVQSEPDDQFILGDDFNQGIRQLLDYNLVYDILIFARQLKPTIEFVDRHPNQSFVLDHIAKPTIAEQFDEQWKIDLCELAKRPHVSCKFSGVVTEVRNTEWSINSVQPYWDVALDAFGPERLMFGSDWPVCLLRSEYQRWVATVEQLTANLSDDEQAAFWGGNAIRIYRL